MLSRGIEGTCLGFELAQIVAQGGHHGIRDHMPGLVLGEQPYHLLSHIEGMIEQVKLQNEELVKKDRLAQFELEKNRSRLVTLERECEDLKSRLSK